MVNLFMTHYTSALLWIMSGSLIPKSDGESALHIGSRSQASCFHSGSLQPVAELWLI